MIGAGGPVSFSADPVAVLAGALFEADFPLLLKPKAPSLLLDKEYVLFALGLLAQSEPAKALRLMRKIRRARDPRGGCEMETARDTWSPLPPTRS